MSLLILQGDGDAPLDPLRNCTVAVIGYGNQGTAHALNLRDSGINVMIGARKGRGASAAEDAGFQVHAIDQAVAQADLIIIALPDEAQPEVLKHEIVPNVPECATLGFIHGFTVHFGLLPDLHANTGVVMIAPKGPGTTLRQRYQSGQGIPCLMAVDRESSRNDSRQFALAWANGIGCARAGIIITTFRDEAVTDLFGEQAVLCGGMTALILTSFQTLVDAGYPAELAYLECCHEVKQVADLVYERGLAGMMKSISNTAEFGAHEAMPIMADDIIRLRFESLLKDVQNGSFARRLRKDFAQGSPWLKEMRAKLAEHPIERVGTPIRRLMPWLTAKEHDTPNGSDECG